MTKRAIKKPKAKRPRGRPQFKPDARTRKRVERLTGCGISPRAIAETIGCDVLTLKKHFAEELEHGVARAKSEILDQLYESADRGNVSAQRKLYSILHGDPDVVKFTPTSTDAGAAKEKKLGKKEQLQDDADNMKGKYEPPSAPKVIN